jgi:hypothetical protein
MVETEENLAGLRASARHSGEQGMSALERVLANVARLHDGVLLRRRLVCQV